MTQSITLKRGQVPKAKKRKAAPAPKAPPPHAAIRLPMSASKARRSFAIGAAVITGVSLAIAALAMQMPARLWFDIADGLSRAGFVVNHVEVAGLKHMSRLPVYYATMDQRSNAMLLVDLEDVRTKLEALPWVEEASVGRRLPDTLMIDIVEREPVAIWQYRQKLAVVDATGHVLDSEGAARFAHLPLIIGQGANRRAGQLAAMLRDFPDLRNHIDSALWIGNRRWDIRFKSGETLALPEGEAAQRRALEHFVRLDRETGLLEKGFIRFDMRLPDRMVVRVTGEPGAAAKPQDHAVAITTETLSATPNSTAPATAPTTATVQH